MFGHAKHPRAFLALCVFAVFFLAGSVAIAILDSSVGKAGGGSPDPAVQIENDYWSHLQSIHSMNISAIEQAYVSNASVQFSARGGGSTGNHSGLRSIGMLFSDDMFPNFVIPRFSKINSTARVMGDSAALDSTFVISGYNSKANPQSALVSVHAGYLRHAGGWLISFEYWNFTFPDISVNGR